MGAATGTAAVATVILRAAAMVRPMVAVQVSGELARQWAMAGVMERVAVATVMAEAEAVVAASWARVVVVSRCTPRSHPR